MTFLGHKNIEFEFKSKVDLGNVRFSIFLVPIAIGIAAKQRRNVAFFAPLSRHRRDETKIGNYLVLHPFAGNLPALIFAASIFKYIYGKYSRYQQGIDHKT